MLVRSFFEPQIHIEYRNYKIEKRDPAKKLSDGSDSLNKIVPANNFKKDSGPEEDGGFGSSNPNDFSFMQSPQLRSASPGSGSHQSGIRSRIAKLSLKSLVFDE